MYICDSFTGFVQGFDFSQMNPVSLHNKILFENNYFTYISCIEKISIVSSLL